MPLFYRYAQTLIAAGAQRVEFTPPGVMESVPGMTTIATGVMKKEDDRAYTPNLV